MSNYQRAQQPPGQAIPSHKENIPRNPATTATTSTMQTNIPQYCNSAPVESPYIEHMKRDSRGGQVLKRYLKGNLLGKGGFARCFRVTDMDTNEDWACKIVQKNSLTKQRHKAKLQTEIKIHRELNHLHVVKFEDVFEDKDNVYILMELCLNQTMLELVKRKKRLTEAETRRYMLQMLDGVRYMHTNKVIHRDLKLGNLFLGKGDEVKIGDFGLACKLQFDGERKRTLCGTPNYIAPEVLDGKDGHSYEVDTWSIGVVLYTCLVGKPPFETADVKSTYKLIKANSYAFPDRVHISEAAKSLIRRILQTEPALRPNIDELILDDFFQGEGVDILRGPIAFPPRPATAVPRPTAAPAPAAPGGGLSSLSSALGLASADGYRPPLHPLASADWDSAPSTAVARRRPPPAGLPEAWAVPLTTTIGRIPAPHSAPSAAASAPRASERGFPADLETVPRIPPPQPPADPRGPAPEPRPAWTLVAPVAPPPAAAPPPPPPPPPPRSVAPAPAGSELNLTPTKLLTQRIGGLDLAPSLSSYFGGAPRDPPPPPPLAVAGDGEDASALSRMHEDIRNALAAAGPSRADLLMGMPLPLPAVWVNRWVDYSKKYGLGYKLSSGCSGVFFNDATKMLLTTDNDRVEYIERMRREDGSKYDIRRWTRLSSHSQDLTKKVTLMQHFKNYLDETQPAGEREADSPHQPSARHGDEAAGVYVRKWMRTRHSIIFRLSNNCLQVNFLDDTEVLLWADRPWATFKAKTRPRRTYQISETQGVSDLAKRLKYMRDILSQLVART